MLIVEPEDDAIPLLGGAFGAVVEAKFDFAEDDFLFHGGDSAEAFALGHGISLFLRLKDDAGAVFAGLPGFEIVVGYIGGDGSDVTFYGFGMGERELIKEATFAVAELEIGLLNEVGGNFLRDPSPALSGADNCKADGAMVARNELLP